MTSRMAIAEAAHLFFVSGVLTASCFLLSQATPAGALHILFFFFVVLLVTSSDLLLVRILRGWRRRMPVRTAAEAMRHQKLTRVTWACVLVGFVNVAAGFVAAPGTNIAVPLLATLGAGMLHDHLTRRGGAHARN